MGISCVHIYTWPKNSAMRPKHDVVMSHKNSLDFPPPICIFTSMLPSNCPTCCILFLSFVDIWLLKRAHAHITRIWHENITICNMYIYILIHIKRSVILRYCNYCYHCIWLTLLLFILIEHYISCVLVQGMCLLAATSQHPYCKSNLTPTLTYVHHAWYVRWRYINIIFIIFREPGRENPE